VACGESGGSESGGKEAMTNTHLLRDLLAIIHSDGGHHTCKVGIDQSTNDAIKLYYTTHLLIARLTRERDELLRLAEAIVVYEQDYYCASTPLLKIVQQAKNLLEEKKP
jgi:hypothetical protein